MSFKVAHMFKPSRISDTWKKEMPDDFGLPYVGAGMGEVNGTASSASSGFGGMFLYFAADVTMS